MTFLDDSMKLNLKRVLMIGIIYCSLEIVGMALSTLGFFETDIRSYVAMIILFHMVFLPFVIKRTQSTTANVRLDTWLVNIYITVIMAWGISITALVYIEQRDITVMAIVLILCASIFITDPKVFRIILISNFLYYMLLVNVYLNDQMAINSMWFKGLLFFVLAYILEKMHYDDRLKTFNLSEQLKEHHLNLSEKVNRDSLSGLYNNAFIYKYLEKKLNDHIIKDSLSVLMMDIDNFKSINDRYGHLFGDQVIKRISDELRESTETTDVLGRYGGEEFILILNNADIERTIFVAEVIRTSIENMTFDYPAKVTISIGIAFYSGETAQDFIKKADDQLYRAKSLGKNRVVREEEEK